MNPYGLGFIVACIVFAAISMIFNKPEKASRLGTLLNQGMDIDAIVKKQKGIPNSLSAVKEDYPGITEMLFRWFGINVEKIEEKRIRADFQAMTSDEIAVLRALSIVCGVIIVFALLAFHTSIYFVLFVALLSVSGYYIPMSRMDEAIEKREKAFLEQFPNFLSALEIPLSNGLPQLRVIKRVAEKTPGIVGYEFRRVVKEAEARGERLEYPLEDLAKRINLPSVSDFVSATISASEKGTNLGSVVSSMGKTLRVQYAQEQEKHNKELASKVLMLSALFFFLPFFLLMLAPMLFRVGSILSRI